MDWIDPQQLQALAHTIESRVVPVQISEEEADFKRQKITEAILAQEQEDETFAEVRKEFTSRKKERAKKVRELSHELKNGYVDRQVVCYDIADHEDGVMRTYDEYGNYVSERRLRPSERQFNVMSVKSIGERTDDGSSDQYHTGRERAYH